MQEHSKAQAGNVFRTYFHHLDNFYEYLDLNKELREWIMHTI